MEWLLLVFFLDKEVAPLEVTFPSQDLCIQASWQVRADYAVQLADKDLIAEPRPVEAPVIVSCVRIKGRPQDKDGIGYEYLQLQKQAAAGGQTEGEGTPTASSGSAVDRPAMPSFDELRDRSGDLEDRRQSVEPSAE